MTTPDYALLPAHQLLAHLANGTVSSRELLELFLSRTDRWNVHLNSVVDQDVEAARRRADAADHARARGERWGALHGLPMTIKDTYAVAGMPCTAGAPQYKDNRPLEHARAVQQLVDAGAIVFGKTNVPFMASDIQSYNAVHGRTNNPWDTERTPGGSSGGAAAALAAGLTPLELGSDIGGSVRIPAHFCGVYGHKTSHGVLSLRGHIPGAPGTLCEPDLAVAGPMARSAEDLALMLDVLVRTPPHLQPGWHFKWPAAKQMGLKDFRVLMWMDDPYCPVDAPTQDAFCQLQKTLADAGVTVVRAGPLGVSLAQIVPLYFHRLGGVVGSSHTAVQRWLMRLFAPVLRYGWRWLGAPPYAHRFLSGCAQSHADWLVQAERVLALRAQFLKTFDAYDVVLMPIAMTTAFVHDHSSPISRRKVVVDGRARAYSDMFSWIAPATLFGLPATSAPMDFMPGHMPMGIQIVGGPHQDKTTIQFAAMLAALTGGFRAPLLN